MKIAVIYCWPQVLVQNYYPLAKRFADPWRRFPPHIEHTLYVAGNGAAVPEFQRTVFDSIPCEFISYNNVGWDIGLFQYCAETIACDLLVCMGSPIHFHRMNWLERMADAFIEHSPALFGCWGYQYPTLHIRTTCFWMPPELLKSYHSYASSMRQSRYEFEHGHRSFTRHSLSCGFECVMATSKGCYPHDQWHDHVPGVEDSLVLDQHTHL